MDEEFKGKAKGLKAKLDAKSDQLYMAVEKKLFHQLEPLSDKGRALGPESEWFLPGVCAHLVMCEILRRQMVRKLDESPEGGEEEEDDE